MQTITCDTHKSLIIVLRPNEEHIFTKDLLATVIFYDSARMPYLKRFPRKGCNDDCPIVKALFTQIEEKTASEAG